MENPADLFVYGTLTDPALVRQLLGRMVPRRPARLPGWRRAASPHHPYPTAVPDPTAVLEGWLLEGLTPQDLAVLDDYEDVTAGLYRRIRVEVLVNDERRPAWLYAAPCGRDPRCGEGSGTV
jgi:gamma-glutamylcyclotransferase (GGCT)/AIG2-like uncharacterized protein YtfP